jgi:hypothetical protein
MSDHYCQFSEAFTVSKKEKEWIDAHLETLGKLDDLDQDSKMLKHYERLYGEDVCFGVGFEAYAIWMKRHNEYRCYINAEQDGIADHAAAFLQQFLKHNRPSESLHLTWSFSCSSLIPGDFGGGAAFITVKKIEWLDTHGWIADMKKAFDQKREAA